MQQRTIIPSNNTHNLITHPIRDSSNIMSFYSSFSLLCLFQSSPVVSTLHPCPKLAPGLSQRPQHSSCTRWRCKITWDNTVATYALNYVIRGKVIAIWCTQMDLTVRILPRDQVNHSQGLLQSTCGWIRSNTMTITPTHALVEANACTILRLCGATLFV